MFHFNGFLYCLILWIQRGLNIVVIHANISGTSKILTSWIKTCVAINSIRSVYNNTRHIVPYMSYVFIDSWVCLEFFTQFTKKPFVFIMSIHSLSYDVFNISRCLYISCSKQREYRYQRIPLSVIKKVLFT